MRLKISKVRPAVAAVAGISALALVPAVADATPAVQPTLKAAALAWISGRQGWVLGSDSCGAKLCTKIAVTANGGKSWRFEGAVPTPIATGSTPADTGVSRIRFATAKVGWAFGPALFRTGDGGKSWARLPVPGGGKQVIALSSGAAGVYALVSPCKEFAVSCASRRLSLWRASPLASKGWTQVKVPLPLNAAASISTFGKTVYVVVPGVPGTLFASTDGRHFSARPSPCGSAQQTGLSQAVATSATKVAFLCTGDPGISAATKTVYLSVNTGKTATSAGTTPALGINAELVASSTGRLLVGAWANGDWMYRHTIGRTWKTALALGDGGAGFGDLTFVTPASAWVVYGPVSAFSADFGRLYHSADGGTHWQLVTLRPSP